MEVKSTGTHPLKQKHGYGQHLDTHQQDKDPGDEVKRLCNRECIILIQKDI